MLWACLSSVSDFLAFDWNLILKELSNNFDYVENVEAHPVRQWWWWWWCPPAHNMFRQMLLTAELILPLQLGDNNLLIAPQTGKTTNQELPHNTTKQKLDKSQSFIYFLLGLIFCLRRLQVLITTLAVGGRGECDMFWLLTRSSLPPTFQV